MFSYLSYQSLLTCGLVCRRWHVLADDQSLWKSLCTERRWEWRAPPEPFKLERDNCPSIHGPGADSDLDDEGMGDEEDDDTIHADDSGFVSMEVEEPTFPLPSPSTALRLSVPAHILTGAGPSDLSPSTSRPFRSHARHSAPTVLQSPATSRHVLSRPNYKLLYKTHVRLHNRFVAGAYTLSNLQTRGAPNSHSNTIYCLQLYTYPESGKQVLFTGSKDRTIREWDLATGAVARVLEGIHDSSVLSICVHHGLLASASSDRSVVVWDLATNRPIKVIQDHEDSVLCVRFDDKRLVSCSKGTFHCIDVQGGARADIFTDRTVRTYLFPDLRPQHVLNAHRAAVNAVSISNSHIVSVSGDRSLRIWDADTGALLRTFENHHRRGYVMRSSLLPVSLDVLLLTAA